MIWIFFYEYPTFLYGISLTLTTFLGCTGISENVQKHL